MSLSMRQLKASRRSCINRSALFCEKQEGDARASLLLDNFALIVRKFHRVSPFDCFARVFFDARNLPQSLVIPANLQIPSELLRHAFSAV